MNIKNHIPAISLSFLVLLVIGAFWAAYHVTVGSDEAQVRNAKVEAELKAACVGVTIKNWGFDEESCTKHRQIYSIRNSKPCQVGAIPLICKDEVSKLYIWTKTGQRVFYDQKRAPEIRKNIVYFSPTTPKLEKETK
jgi:hypothetical protein